MSDRCKDCGSRLRKMGGRGAECGSCGHAWVSAPAEPVERKESPLAALPGMHEGCDYLAAWMVDGFYCNKCGYTQSGPEPEDFREPARRGMMADRTPGELATRLESLSTTMAFGTTVDMLREAATVLRGMEGERVEGYAVPIDEDESGATTYFCRADRIPDWGTPATLTLHRTEGET